MTTCLACGHRIPTGRVWCSQICRNLDDRHDLDDYDTDGDD